MLAIPSPCPPCWNHSNRAARQSPFEFRPQSHRAMFSHRAYTDKPASGSEAACPNSGQKRERYREGVGAEEGEVEVEVEALGHTH